MPSAKDCLDGIFYNRCKLILGMNFQLPSVRTRLDWLDHDDCAVNNGYQTIKQFVLIVWDWFASNSFPRRPHFHWTWHERRSTAAASASQGGPWQRDPALVQPGHPQDAASQHASAAHTGEQGHDGGRAGAGLKWRSWPGWLTYWFQLETSTKLKTSLSLVWNTVREQLDFGNFC